MFFVRKAQILTGGRQMKKIVLFLGIFAGSFSSQATDPNFLLSNQSEQEPQQKVINIQDIEEGGFDNQKPQNQNIARSKTILDQDGPGIPNLTYSVEDKDKIRKVIGPSKCLKKYTLCTTRCCFLLEQWSDSLAKLFAAVHVLSNSLSAGNAATLLAQGDTEVQRNWLDFMPLVSSGSMALSAFFFYVDKTAHNKVKKGAEQYEAYFQGLNVNQTDVTKIV